MGIAVRRSTPRATVLVGFGTAFLAALAFFGLQQPPLTLGSFLWGAAAGVAQGLGWVAFARGLRDSNIGIAAPTAATVTALTLYLANVIQGRHVSAISLAGMVVALAALTLFRRTPTRGNISTPRASAGVVFSGAAGLAFAGQALALVRAGTASSSLVVVGTGLGVLVFLGGTAALRPIPLAAFRSARRGALPGGFAIFLGDVLYLYALKGSVPVTVSVIAQMHPLVTALLAFALLTERLRRAQVAAILLACVGVTTIVLG